ncbi:MAG: sporulation protein YqfC [Lachnospiraceae bacterium]|nr:sporulation protein YqfC [Lachnospiraceae bacterium]
MGDIIKRGIAETLKLPKEVVLSLPLISITGREEFFIENLKGIIEYTEEKIRLKTNSGILKIEGSGMVLKSVSDESLEIKGKISKIEFMD